LAIIAILAALLLPSLAAAKEKGRRAVCVSNLRQLGIAIHTYSHDHDGTIPFGPKAPPFTSPASFYPSTGAPTSLLSLQNGSPVALGLLLDSYLAGQREVVFCPGSDQPLDTEAELEKIGTYQAQSSYYYRHAGNTQLFDNPNDPFRAGNLRLSNLGLNRAGIPIRALVIDSQFLSPPELEAFNIKPRTHHRQTTANALYADGHVSALPNRSGRFTVDLRDFSQIRDAFNKILTVLEEADSAD
jgi:prepilin-type processing-associated H-X9-DG protein